MSPVVDYKICFLHVAFSSPPREYVLTHLSDLLHVFGNLTRCYKCWFIVVLCCLQPSSSFRSWFQINSLAIFVFLYLKLLSWESALSAPSKKNLCLFHLGLHRRRKVARTWTWHKNPLFFFNIVSNYNDKWKDISAFKFKPIAYAVDDSLCELGNDTKQGGKKF